MEVEGTSQKEQENLTFVAILSAGCLGIAWLLLLPVWLHFVVGFFALGVVGLVSAGYSFVRLKGIMYFLSPDWVERLTTKSLKDCAQEFNTWFYAPTGVVELISLFVVPMNKKQKSGTIRRMPSEMKKNVNKKGLLKLMSPDTQR